jgi:hypothetical protein
MDETPILDDLIMVDLGAMILKTWYFQDHPLLRVTFTLLPAPDTGH